MPRFVVHASLALVVASNGLAAQKPQKQLTVASGGHASTPAKAPASPDIARRLRVPTGFSVSVFSQDVAAPRMFAVSDGGVLYVTRRDSGDVMALRDDGTGKGTKPVKVVANMPAVHGIVLHGGRMYLATNNEVYVADMASDGSVGMPRAIITDLPDAGQHPNRTLGVGADNMLYITVGSTCNQCREANGEAATILRATLDGTERGVFARGLRNTIGFGWHPATGELWGMDHGIDWKGDDVPREELNLIQGGSHYGWPFCIADKRVDSTFTGDPLGSTKEALCPRTVAPIATYTAHGAPLQMVFYTGAQFPAEFRNDAFIALRGSWNREPPAGYAIARIRFTNGKSPRIENFLTGFLSDDRRTYYGRPAGVAMLKDGSLVVGDDTNGLIYRIAYTGGR